MGAVKELCACRERNEAIAATYTFSKLRTSDTLQIAGSGDRGCALLLWRASDNLPIAEDSLHVCTEPWSEWWFIYKTTDVLSVWISTCCCSSCGKKYFRVKKTASSSKQFCNTGSEVLTLATKPSDTAPRTRVDASVVTTTHDVSWHHGLRASMLPRETALRKRPVVHAVQLTLF